MQLGSFWLITMGTLTGPWHVASHSGSWYIVNIIKDKHGTECKRIGKVKMRGVNYCDRAREVARERNEEFLKKNKEELPLYLGICPEFDETIMEALKK